MGNQTTGPGASGDAGEQAPDYAAKYNGLQQAFQKRTNDFTAKEQSWEAEKADYEAKLAKLADYEAREQAEREERDAEAQYEALRERFYEPPTPGRHNEARDPRRDLDDGSAAWLERQLDKASGGKPEAWPI